MERVSGIRKSGGREREALQIIECLKKFGLEIKDIVKTIQCMGIRRRTACGIIDDHMENGFRYARVTAKICTVRKRRDKEA